MKNKIILIQIKKTLVDIINILKEEDENNWVRAFIKMGCEVDKAISDDNLSADALKYIRDTYRSICQGNGSFSDFYIWRNNPKERIEANNNFKLLISKLSELSDE